MPPHIKPWHIIIAAVVSLPLLPVIIPLAAIFGLMARVKGIRLAGEFRKTWGVRGKAGVLVYSDDPTWKDPFEDNIFPRAGDRLVKVDWSSRSQWKEPKPVEIRLAEHWAGRGEFHPVAIIIPKKGRTRFVHFWHTIKGIQIGSPESIQRLTENFFELIEAV